MTETWSFNGYIESTHQLGLAFFRANAAILSITDMSTGQAAFTVIHQCMAFLANDSGATNRVAPAREGSFWKDVHEIERSYDYMTGAYLIRRLREVNAEVKFKTGAGQPATVDGVAHRTALCLFLKKIAEETGHTLETLIQGMEAYLATHYKDFIENPDKINTRMSDDMQAYCIGLVPMLPLSPR